MGSATLSTVIDAKVKRLLGEYCKRHGLKLQYVVEQSILDRLEDEYDLEVAKQRENEETVPFERVRKSMKKSR